jgi:hypothetical protein
LPRCSTSPAGRRPFVQQRAQATDHLDIDALVRHGTDLPCVLAAGAIVYGRGFNPPNTLDALSYFDGVPSLPAEMQERLQEAVDPVRLPVLTSHARTNDNGRAP